MRRSALTIAICLAVAPAAAVRAQTAPAATGTVLWIRTGGRSATDLAAGFLGAPQFTIGVRRERMTIGVGIGFLTARSTNTYTPPGGGSGSEDRTSVTVYQAGPTILWDVRRSADGRVRVNVVTGVSLGRVSYRNEYRYTDFLGQPVTSTSTTSGTLLGGTIGLGGDYFLHPHFAIGLESGFQGTFLKNLKDDGGSDRYGANANGLYSGLRATLVF